jgi:hypothetical protein
MPRKKPRAPPGVCNTPNVPPDLHQPGRWSWSPLPLFAASFLRSGLIVRVRFYLLWPIVGMVGAVPSLINLSQFYSHIGDDLQGDVSEFMTTCADWFFRSVAWFSCRTSDLVRSRCVAGVRGYLRRR